ncbi:MAG: hypothetical protein ABSC00_02530 [Acidimicrobiales bacterium]|jgi:hypothetical protein
MDPEEDEERASLPGDFESNLKAILEVDPEALEDGEEEPPQD